MRSRAWYVLLLCFVCSVSFADTLVMKSGENKKGKIIQETDKTVLFNSQADGLVVEIPKSSIAIVDRDVSKTPQGALQFFSAAPRKSKAVIDLPPPNIGSAQPDLEEPPAAEPEPPVSGQAAAMQTLLKKVEDWVRSHPEAEKYIQSWAGKFKGNQDEVDKLVKKAKEA